MLKIRVERILGTSRVEFVLRTVELRGVKDWLGAL